MEAIRLPGNQLSYALALTLLFNCVTSTHGAPDDARPFIVDPYAADVPLSRFPYMCTLRQNGVRTHACGGILVHPRWVLTAAHCIDPNGKNSVGLNPVIYCGTRDIDDDNPHLTFVTVGHRMAKSWSGNTFDGHDIALLKLDREALLTIPRLNDFGNPPRIGQSLAAIGWGRTADTSLASVLQITRRLRPVSFEDCAESWKETVNIKEDIMLCAKGAGADTCDGDSGGPLFVPDNPGRNLAAGRPHLDVIFGVVSFGPADCANDTRPAVYTDVGYFKNWIQSVTSPTPLAPPASPTGARSRKVLLEEMVEAIERDDAMAVESILQEGLDPNSRNANFTAFMFAGPNGTLLHGTATIDAVESAKVLIRHGADLDATAGYFGETPLHECASFNSSRVAQVLLDAGADVNAVSMLDGTPLLRAAYANSVATCKILLQYGADVTAAGVGGDTPLHDAARFAHIEVVRILLDARAPKTSVDEEGNRPVDVICQGIGVECTDAEKQTLIDLLTP